MINSDNIGQNKINPEEMLRNGQTIQLEPTGYSMYPLIDPKKKDQAVIQPVWEGNIKKVRKIKTGDVLLFRREGGILVLHRLIRKKKDGYYFTGDNQTVIEGPIRPDQVAGIMRARIRNGRETSLDNVFMKIIYTLWMWMFPIRPFIYSITRKIRKRKNGK